MRIYSLYVATLPDGKRYVGCTSRSVHERWGDHRRVYPRDWPGEAEASFTDAVKLFGYSQIMFEHVASAIGSEAATATERALIEQYGSRHPHGYNRNMGGPCRAWLERRAA